MYSLYCSHKVLGFEYLWNGNSCSEAKLQQKLNLVHHSLEHLFGSQKLLEHSQGATQPSPDDAFMLGRVAQSHSKREENIWWKGKYQPCCTSTQRDIKNMMYAAGARSRKGVLSLQEGSEKGWHTSVRRGMASSPFERIPRELGSARILGKESWSFLSLPKGIKWCLWGGRLCTAVLWKLTPSR